MSVPLIHADELANVLGFLTRHDASDSNLHAVAEDLAIWSQANTRAHNEDVGSGTGPLSMWAIIKAYRSNSFRYDRKRAIRTLYGFLACVTCSTKPGDPSTFEEFDSARYFQAYARIMELAFTRMANECACD